MDTSRQFCGRTRRDFLWNTGAGFPAVALSGMLGSDFLARATRAADGTPLGNPLAPKKPKGDAKAKAVIFLFMYGGPSHMDTFDYKPKLYPLDGKTIPVKTFRPRRPQGRWPGGGPQVAVQAGRPVRQDDLRPVPQPAGARR